MKFSEAWLRQWVNPPLEREPLLHQMTMAGLEVDGVEVCAQSFSGVVIGKITSAEQHPNADKLRVCQVSDGKETHQVVCGAPNAREGLVTAFARVGAVLPGNFKIKKAKLRGVESRGMLCSEHELGLGEEADGIMKCHFQVGADLATLVSEDLPLDDVTVDVDLTPNRGDCLSLMGLAREVGVLNQLPVTYPKHTAVTPESETTFPVEVQAQAQCPRYLGRVIQGVDLSRATPDWMRERLRRCGLRTIDPVVDVTNYILIELGQPMHAFDLGRLNQGIVVRLAEPGDELKLLDGQQVTLDDRTLVIADARGPLAIAGVMGGEGSGVGEETRDIFLECAFFDPIAIAGTARRYGLHTDASHRYERGVDSELQHWAMERATALLLDCVGGTAGPVEETVNPAGLPNRQPVQLRQQKLDAVMGVAIDPAQVDDALQRLDFRVANRTNTDHGIRWDVISPSHRFDIAIEADLVEEICRIYGYNNIPVSQPRLTLPLAEVPLYRSEARELRTQLAAQGYQEVITYSFVDPALQQLFDPASNPLALANPMSSEQSVMRTTLLPGLVDAARGNIARQQDGGRLFEMGMVFQQQAVYLGGIQWGPRQGESWHGRAQALDFYDLKGEVEALCQWAGIRVDYRPSELNTLHPGQSAQLVLDDEVIGHLGRLHPAVEKQLGLSGIFVFEIQAEAILLRPERLHHGFSRFPSVRRDLAIVVDEQVAAQALIDALAQGLDERCIDIVLFDVYVGEGIDSNKKSLGLGLTFQSQETTLTDEEINGYAAKALALLGDRFGATQR